MQGLNISLEVLEGHIFAEKLRSTESNPHLRYIYEALINDLDENGNLVYDSNIKLKNDVTLRYLKMLGFDWSEVDERYIKGYVEYFRRMGYLKV